jgi:acetyltransferase-like isoleucine patch superfamily enzyme
MNISFIQRVRNKIKVDKNSTLNIAPRTKITGCNIDIKGKNNKIIIKENCRIKNSFFEIEGDNCTIFIDENSIVGYNCYLSAKEENISIIIGKNCMLSRNIKIMTSDGHPIYQNDKRINHAKSITIEDHVWLADNVTILKGVTIGSNTVVGINSTVVKDIENNAIAAGNPAKTVKQNINWQH